MNFLDEVENFVLFIEVLWLLLLLKVMRERKNNLLIIREVLKSGEESICVLLWLFSY